MPLSKLIFKPGVNRDQTNYAAEGGWYECNLIRFRSGFPEKIGGWTVRTTNWFEGSARSLLAWATTDGGSLLGIGTNEKIYVEAGSNVYDITPLRQTFTHATAPSTDNMFYTTSGSNRVDVHLVGYGSNDGDYVSFTGSAAVGGIPAAEINTNHELFKDATFPNDRFYFLTTTNASSTVAGGGGTAITADFEIPIGNAIVTAGYGWSTGGYGTGMSWGSGTITPIYQPARLVFQDKFNNDLIFNVSGSDIYYWAYTSAFNTRAIKLSAVGGAIAIPQQVGKILFASTGHLIAFGCTNYDGAAAAPDYLGAYDPMLIRWANVDPDIGPEPENWQPLLTNTSGFQRLTSGSQIIAALHTRQEIIVFTEISLYSMQFLGTAEVFGVQEISSAISIFGPNVAISANNITFWMGRDKFYTYSGRVDTLPCTLRQYVFADINHTQGQIFFAGTNNQYNEIIWFYCSAASDDIDRYVIYNHTENIWYYGNLHRTAWIDYGTRPFPQAASSSAGPHSGWIYNHEDGNDDGQPLGAPPAAMDSYIQSADVDIADGDQFMLTRRIIPDVNFSESLFANPVTQAPLTPQVQITVAVRDFPGANAATINAEGQSTTKNVTTATATVDTYTNQVFVRARGRQMSFRIGSTGVGVQWQLGMPRVDARPDGRRG